MPMRRLNRVSKGRRPPPLRLPPFSSRLFDPDQTVIGIHKQDTIYPPKQQKRLLIWAGRVKLELMTVPADDSKKPQTITVEPEQTPVSLQHAFLVRKVKCDNGGLEFSSIVVQSVHLKRVLAMVMDGYPGISMSHEGVEFSKPFKPFIHRWKIFAEARGKEFEAEAKAHVDSLYEVLSTELNDVITRKNDLVLYNVITFNMLWTIFEPGHIILSIVNGCERAFRLEGGEYTSDSKEFKIYAVYIDYNGHVFGYRKYNLSIPAFEGTTSIMMLPVIPFEYHNDKHALRKNLILRGQRWYQHKGFHYKLYNGLGLVTYMGREIGHNISSRVMVDTETYLAFHSDKFSMELEDISEPLADEQFLIATPILRGYSLDDRKWMEFFVMGVSDIIWNPRPFTSLVLPDGIDEDLKDLVLAFTSSQSANSEFFDNVPQGKGRSVTMLLHGPPGVGKTLTAECVAEVMKVPLYALSARALGTTAVQAEESLQFALRMVDKWGAVLLIDNADIFIQERNPSYLQNNELSYVLLTLLENYEGVLILASNGVETIDPAFESRIDVHIHYSELDDESRRHIWKCLLGETETELFSKYELRNLAGRELNGRQIKKLVKSARTLARYQGTKLSYEHILTVMKLVHPAYGWTDC
ncbi:ATP-binding protein [Aspergillus vadensis CBS 113365]|uniref:AAA family ATPase n=1 Tax=Aspergillus vadensis (strain CBS 113365 / IMI 142717 / IBT 24658) TaxID=1448311 RepID=A0A319CXJ9_ASPVC|nr:AAA family ATPase [Aspergillus vadensis CBS 113365]PYH72792.1 AAA family ATPase [Aspergillus vadensis CBS 113365]